MPLREPVKLPLFPCSFHSHSPRGLFLLSLKPLSPSLPSSISSHDLASQFIEKMEVISRELLQAYITLFNQPTKICAYVLSPFYVIMAHVPKVNLPFYISFSIFTLLRLHYCHQLTKIILLLSS